LIGNNATTTDEYDAVVIGAGFYGCAIANHIKNKFSDSNLKVLLIEKENKIMSKSSQNNQARVHGGYHYPRSLNTGLRSRENYSRFIKDYKSSISSNYNMYYAIMNSPHNKTTAAQFEAYCNLINAPLMTAESNIENLFTPNLTESIYKADESVFNINILRAIMLKKIITSEVELLTNSQVQSITPCSQGSNLAVSVSTLGSKLKVKTSQIYLCTYSLLNSLLLRSSIEPIPLKHQMVEIPLITPPEQMSNIGITAMDGPFFSILPFPSLGLHSFTHVSYSPHGSWLDPKSKIDKNLNLTHMPPKPNESNIKSIIYDSARYMPILKKAKYIRSIYEVKTVLPRNEYNDGRPILMKKNHGLSGLHCILGGKMDNIYDVLALIN